MPVKIAIEFMCLILVSKGPRRKYLTVKICESAVATSLNWVHWLSFIEVVGGGVAEGVGDYFVVQISV